MWPQDRMQFWEHSTLVGPARIGGQGSTLLSIAARRMSSIAPLTASSIPTLGVPRRWLSRSRRKRKRLSNLFAGLIPDSCPAVAAGDDPAQTGVSSITTQHDQDLARLAAGHETGWRDSRSIPAPWPDDIDDWRPETNQPVTPETGQAPF